MDISNFITVQDTVFVVSSAINKEHARSLQQLYPSLRAIALGGFTNHELFPALLPRLDSLSSPGQVHLVVHTNITSSMFMFEIIGAKCLIQSFLIQALTKQRSFIRAKSAGGGHPGGVGRMSCCHAGSSRPLDSGVHLQPGTVWPAIKLSW